MPDVYLPMQQRHSGDALTLTLSRRERELRIPLWFQFRQRNFLPLRGRVRVGASLEDVVKLSCQADARPCSVILAKAGIQNHPLPQGDLVAETSGFRLSPE